MKETFIVMLMKKYGLNKKEARLYKYRSDCRKKGIEPTIGDICRDCKTTVHTLLTKTSPSLDEKLRKRGLH